MSNPNISLGYGTSGLALLLAIYVNVLGRGGVNPNQGDPAFSRKRRGRENAPIECSSTRRYGANLYLL